MAESIKVFSPATVANVSCGFDILGFAVNKPGDEVILKKKASKGLEIKEITGDEGKLSYDPMQNTVSVSIQKYLDHIGYEYGFEIYLHKKMPLGSGLGSSAASASAGVFAVNKILGEPLQTRDLIIFAMEGERIACGSAHADNVAPSILGGFVLIRSYDPLDIIKLPTPVSLYSTIIHPQIEIKTKDARDLLKKQIYLKDAVNQWGNIAGFIAGLMQSDFDLIGRSMQDVIIEPIRSILIPGYNEVKLKAMEAGALGFGISGSGPSLFALSTGISIAENVGKNMAEVFNKMDVDNSVYVSKINHSGPQVIA